MLRSRHQACRPQAAHHSTPSIPSSNTRRHNGRRPSHHPRFKCPDAPNLPPPTPAQPECKSTLHPTATPNHASAPQCTVPGAARCMVWSKHSICLCVQVSETTTTKPRPPCQLHDPWQLWSHAAAIRLLLGKHVSWKQPTPTHDSSPSSNQCALTCTRVSRLG